MLRPLPFQMTTGPVQPYPAVLAALARPVLYDGQADYLGWYEGVIGKARAAMGTDGMPVVLQAEAILGLEAAAASLIGRGDVVLNLVSGVYGRGFGGWARRHAREVIEVAVPYDEAIEPDAVAEALRQRPDVSVIAVCHHDTPSGTVNPVSEIAQLAVAHGAPLIVDAVSSFGGMEIAPAVMEAGILVASPAKCLGGVPGLTLMAVSEPAWARMAANPDAPRGSFLSLLDWREAWRADRPFPVTPSLAEVHALEAALDLYLTEGPQAVWRRHARTAAAMRAGLLAMGLELWPRREAIAADTATVLRLPEGVSDVALRDLMAERHGVLASLGRRDTAGHVLRFGHMGSSAQPGLALVALAALGGALGALGRPVDTAAGLAAAAASIERSPHP